MQNLVAKYRNDPKNVTTTENFARGQESLEESPAKSQLFFLYRWEIKDCSIETLSEKTCACILTNLLLCMS